jgi:uncharacterized protein (DUF934 family)
MTLLSLTGIEIHDWPTLADDETPQEGASVLVPIERLLKSADTVFASAGKVGALVPTGTNHRDLADLIDKLALVVVEFPAFTDGRGFSLGVRLRKDLRFKGEIRATGPVMPDQALFLLRAGFDSVVITDARRMDAFKVALNRFKDFYQTDYTGARSVAYARHSNFGARIAS